MIRTTCPRCGKPVALRTGGYTVAHTAPPSADEGGPLRRCTGARVSPLTPLAVPCSHLGTRLLLTTLPDGKAGYVCQCGARVRFVAGKVVDAP